MLEQSSSSLIVIVMLLIVKIRVLNLIFLSTFFSVNPTTCRLTEQGAFHT